MRLACLLALFAGLRAQDPAPARRVLLLTHSAGFRHDSIPAARASLETLAPERFAVTATEDLSFITAERLKHFQAVFFFTSGELALDDQQKADLLDYIRAGGGFAGAHSATDTLYGWAEYGDLIGGYFDGHPWVGETDVEIEDPDHPAAKDLRDSFRIVEEIYRFRDFSRDRSRVLMTLRSSIGEPQINKAEYPLDSPLAWCRSYGKGRAFYTALGHFDETWRDPRIRRMLLHALAWLTGDGDAAATPRQGAKARIDRVVEAAQQSFEGFAAPGAIVSVLGENLTSGSTMRAEGEPAHRLAGTWAWLDHRPARIVFASPGRVDLLLPGDAPVEGSEGIRIASSTEDLQARVEIAWRAATPGIYRAEVKGEVVVVTAGGLGSSAPRADVDGVDLEPTATALLTPGVWELRFKKPFAVGPGARTLRLTADGFTAAFEVHWP